MKKGPLKNGRHKHKQALLLKPIIVCITLKRPLDYFEEQKRKTCLVIVHRANK